MNPDTTVYNIIDFAGWSSLENAWHQVDELGKQLISICGDHPEGVHLLGMISRNLMHFMRAYLYRSIIEQDILKEVYFHGLFWRHFRIIAFRILFH